ncbi:uncharacterized protein LOC120175251 [Hibiscus syriacus]|uniref:uncharacterized protein LOC120175251 n=1 Tax=Hibiscus syriacus TaxID=106335 RepID=UPI0019233494|nr:uncharacterized protein LOC120175251 [Hibiscus syriacus]
MKEILRIYGTSSGQVVNFDKLGIVFSSNVIEKNQNKEGQLGYLLKRGGTAGLVEAVGELLWWRGCYRWLLEGAGNARGGAAVIGCWIGKEGQLGYLLKRGGIAGLVEVVGELLWWRGCYRWLLEGAGNARGGAAVVVLFFPRHFYISKFSSGSQALVSFVLQQEIPADFSLVAEEDSKDLRKDGDQEIVERITKLVNDSITSDGSYNVTLSTEDVLKAIDSGRSEAGSQGRHWVLDPIDGTKGFLRGDKYAIALALLDGGKVVLGVLACPNPTNVHQCR